jgi:hypothetical protein
MVHYQLCGSNMDCPAGSTCSMMAPYAPYCMTPLNLDGGFRDGASRDGGQVSSDASEAGGD